MSYTRWLFTVNNYSDVHLNRLGIPDSTTKGQLPELHSGHLLGPIRRFVVGFEVAPTTGTPHLQGYLEFSKRQSLSACKRILDTAHWEAAKGTSYQNHRYCVKDGVFAAYGDWSNLKAPRGKSSSTGLSNTAIVRNLLQGNKLNLLSSDKYMRAKRSYDEMSILYADAVESKRRYDFFSKQKLSLWQMQIIRRVFVQNDRKILWVSDCAGGHGKTFLGHFLNSCYGFELFDGITKACDIAHLLPATPRGIVFDVTRADSNHFSYQTLEMCKNGFVMSGKYYGIKRVFSPPPVIVFANFEPERSRLTSDRWEIHSLDDSIQWEEKIFTASEHFPYCPPQEAPSLQEEEEDKENIPPSKKQHVDDRQERILTVINESHSSSAPIIIRYAEDGGAN